MRATILPQAGRGSQLYGLRRPVPAARGHLHVRVVRIMDGQGRRGEGPALGAIGETLDGVGQTASELSFSDAVAALVAVDDFLPHSPLSPELPDIRTGRIIAHN